MNEGDLLTLHRELVAIPSVSHEESALCAWLSAWLEKRGVEVFRVGNSLCALTGSGPVLCFNSHLDTVPPSPAWTRAPHVPVVENGRVYGLGANDAKASVAAMVAAFIRIHKAGLPGMRLLLTLVAEEETGGKGTEMLLPELAQKNLTPQMVVVGEPTGLDIVVAQKGLLVLEARAHGTACHAAHAKSLNAQNAVRNLARDLLALENVPHGAAHPLLGPVTWEPTVISGGQARNQVPAEATCILDVRTNPEEGAAELLPRFRQAVAGEIHVLSDRLAPCAISPEHALVQAAQSARPKAPLAGSRTVSDWVFFRDIPGIKIGPGDSARSHTADEFVYEREILEGAQFYEQLARHCALPFKAKEKA